MQKLTIFDLDRTITKSPTFTPFLIHCAWHFTPWRLLALPLWPFLLLGYWLGLFSRKKLKIIGLYLFIGKKPHVDMMKVRAAHFANALIPDGLYKRAIDLIHKEQKEGRVIMIISAAPSFYIDPIADYLKVPYILSTESSCDENGNIVKWIQGDNMYGPAKLTALQNWLKAMDWHRSESDIYVYSDHISDAPILNYADKGFLVAARNNDDKVAKENGWTYVDFR